VKRLALALKGLCIVVMIGAPLAGVWVASSLAAFANRATWMPVAAGLLLFPGLPLAWEGWSALRAKSRPTKRFLTFSDRMILRTLALNVLFLVVLLAAFPERAFVALSSRGDWMLDGHHGPIAEKTRRVLLGSAGAVEWLYKATHENPYREEEQHDEVKHDPKPTNVTPVPTTSTSSSSSTPPPPPPPPTSVAYPMPATIHPIVANMPPEVETSIANVGKYIAEHETNQVMRIKALHDYVADRIAYDAPAYAAGHIPHEDGDPQAVFRSRKGVCAGYAALLRELGKATGDEIVYVVGDARSARHPMEGESHAWNAVKIGGGWYLLDATWDAGPVDGTKFEKKYSTEYLFTPPDVFAVSHYPEQAKWQLLAEPMTHAEFFRRPVLAPTFFRYGLELRAPDRSQVTTNGPLAVNVANPNDVFLLADYGPKNGGARTNCKGDNKSSFQCSFPAAGTYDVRLYVNRERYGTYAYAGSVEVNAQ
jgi:transglutaminase-like putative cysteine protease